MNKTGLTIAAFLWLCATAVFSQADSTRYINGLPITRDTVNNSAGPDLAPRKRLVVVKRRELPASLLEVLEREDQYQGWQDTIVYHDLNTGLYLVPVRDHDGIKIFGLNDKGDPVTFREVSSREEQ